METDEESTMQNEEQVMVAYPNNEESLMELFHRFQQKKSAVMLCPRCSSVFGKKVVESIERVRVASCRRNWKDTRNHYTFDKRGFPRRKKQ